MNIMGRPMLPKQWSMTLWILPTGIFVLFALVLMGWQKPTPLRVVDMTRTIQTPSIMLAHSKLTPDAQAKIMSRFSLLLPKVIKEYGQRHRVTIVNATILASTNNIDVTNEVVELTITRMKNDA